MSTAPDMLTGFDPFAPEAHAGLAFSLSAQGKQKETVTVLENAVRAVRDDPFLLYLLSWALNSPAVRG